MCTNYHRGTVNFSDVNLIFDTPRLEVANIDAKIIIHARFHLAKLEKLITWY